MYGQKQRMTGQKETGQDNVGTTAAGEIEEEEAWPGLFYKYFYYVTNVTNA